VDRSAIDIVNFPISEGGRGAIALKDVPVSLAFVVARHFLEGPRKGTLYSRSLGHSSWVPELAHFLLNLASMHGKVQG